MIAAFISRVVCCSLDLYMQEHAMPTTPVSLRLDEQTRARLAAEAARSDRPLAQVASRAIASWLDAQDELRRQIDAAAEEADRGVFVTREAVGAWMDKWGTEAEGQAPAPDLRLAGGADA
jgi:predicted transcriptional regulator